MGFGVWDFGFGVWGFLLRVPGFYFRAAGFWFGFLVSSFGLGIFASRAPHHGLGLRV